MSAITAAYLAVGCLASAGLHTLTPGPFDIARVLAAARATPPATSPSEFIQHDHGFAVVFRGIPFPSIDEVAFYDDSTLPVRTFDVSGPGSMEKVSATALPCEFEASAAPGVVSSRWEYEVDSLAQAIGGTPALRESEETTFQSFPAHTGKFAITDNAGRRTIGTLMTIMRGASLIHVLTTSDTAGDPDSDQQQQTFRESFRLLDEPVPHAPACKPSTDTDSA